MDQRFYTSQFGRFLSADRFKQAAKANDSGTWNKYSYTRGDPVNRFDHHGTEDCGEDEDCPEDPCDDGSCDEGPGPDKPTPVKDPPKTDCRSNFTSDQINFVTGNFVSASILGAQSGVSSTDILGWAALETGWGTNTASKVNQNFFSWGGKGNATCPDNADPAWGCFTSFYNSGLTALFSTQNYFTYDGKTRVSAASILTNQFNNGATVAQAFDALAHAGYTPDAGYGAGVASRTNQVLNVEICLHAVGQLP